MTLRYLTAGESHGQALVGILEGFPSGVRLSAADLAPQMQRRKLGWGRGARQQIETDGLSFLSGVRFGETLGSPIAVLLPNRDWENWKDIMQVEPGDASKAPRQVTVPRPGHADRTGGIKYHHRDLRNVLERASARETAMRVALGSIARQLLEALLIKIASRVVQIGSVCAPSKPPADLENLNQKTDASPVRCDDPTAGEAMCQAITEAKAAGDTLGGRFEVWASGVPLGLGSYSQWDRRLEGRIGAALMSLNAIKAVEVGMGAEVANHSGSAVHDAFALNEASQIHHVSNRAGGIEGGMSSGQPIVMRATMKPLSTLKNPLPSVDQRLGVAAAAHTERSDVCAVPAAAVVAESLVALTLAGEILEKFGGDSLAELEPRVASWRKHSIGI